MSRRSFYSLSVGLLLAFVFQLLLAAPATAYPFGRTLRVGSYGADVLALEIRIAGWYPPTDRRLLRVDRYFGGRTATAVRAFQRFHRLRVDGIAGARTFAALNRLEDRDGSTVHFNWSEFKQNYNRACSAKANAYAGTFSGGMVSATRTRAYVRRVMWRLEAIRAKGGHRPIGINSGFRSIAYNSCIGGARSSQHLYGTAADNRMAEVTNRYEREVAKGSQIHGIACYSSRSHNHFDIRIENTDLRSTRFWWWPRRDALGRDLDASGRPCWGEGALPTRSVATSSVTLLDVLAARPGAGSLTPSEAEVRAFEEAGEAGISNGSD